jgi:uncharacterized cupredoxin-like copper-binding protein
MKLNHYTRSLYVAGLVAALSTTAVANIRADQNAVVNIELKEWHIQSDTDHVKAGPVTFRASNHGKEQHELVIVKTDLPLDRLPMHDGKVDEDEAGKFIGEIEEFSPGSTQEVSFELKPGRYVLFCNIVEREDDGKLESHYHEGMRVAFDVVE